jgi:hypothetical protein
MDKEHRTFTKLTPASSDAPLMLRTVRWISLLATAVTLSALAAHVLELPNKLTLAGPLWLAVQQQLYRGWGPVIGPFEVTAIVATWVLCFLGRQRSQVFRLTLLAAGLLSAALVAFFALTAPVNAAFAAWTPTTLPPNWPRFRLRWEAGHALAFACVLPAFIALVRALCLDVGGRRSGTWRD